MQNDYHSEDRYIGKRIQIGIRPEHIVLCEDENNSTAPDATLEVTAYENMGNEQLVYLALAAQTLIVRRAPRETVDVGKQKEVRFLKEKIIYMNEESGEVINAN